MTQTGRVRREGPSRILRRPSQDATERSQTGVAALARAVVDAAVGSWRRIALWLSAGIALAALQATLTPPAYVATATLLLEPRPQGLSEAATSRVAEQLDENRADTEMQIIRSDLLIAKVFDGLQLDREPDIVDPQPTPFERVARMLRAALPSGPTQPMTPGQARQFARGGIAARLSVQRVGFSNVLQLTFTAPDPALARRGVGAVASAYIWQSIVRKGDAAAAGAVPLRARIEALKRQADAAEAAIATGPLPASATPDADAQLMSFGPEPLRRSAPQTGLLLALGAVLGLMGAMIAVMLDLSSRRIRTPADLAQAVGLPCLAAVPEAVASPPTRSPAVRMDGADPAEASVAAAVQLLAATVVRAAQRASRDPYTLALVAWAPGQGCSVLSRRLASVLRDRHPAVRVVDAGSPATSSPTTAARNDAPQRLAVLDLPPLGTHPGALAAAAAADAVVIVAAAGVGTSREVAEACRALLGAGATLLGTVLNRVPV